MKLPCYVRPLGPSDSITLVLWYRGEDISGVPIYSVDGRFVPAQHFAHEQYANKSLVNFTMATTGLDDSEVDEEGSAHLAQLKSTPTSGSAPQSVINTRLTAMLPTSASTTAATSTAKPASASTGHLHVRPVEESDAGLYWCRVDYKWERTTISIVTVNVIGKRTDPIETGWPSVIICMPLKIDDLTRLRCSRLPCHCGLNQFACALLRAVPDP